MLSLIFPFFDQVIDFFNAIFEFINTGIYTFFKEVFKYLTKVSIYAYLQGQLFLLEVSYEVAKELMKSFGVSSFIESSYGRLSADVASTMAFFGIPQAINILLSGLSTRFAMKFIPFMGR